jgi:hypothetical protein
MNSWVDLSDFFWLFGDGWRKVPFDDQRRRSFKIATMAAILDLVSVDYLTNPWVDWSTFFVASLEVTGGRFLSMTSTSAHSRWPPRQPSWIWFLSII